MASAEEFARRLEAIRAAHADEATPHLFDGCYELLGVIGAGAKACSKPLAELRRYDPEGPLLSKVQLGELINDTWPLALEWSPAGYMVVAISAIKGAPFSFYVHAYSTGQQDPLWTYQHPEPNSFNVSLALAIGPFGEVYAGGFGSVGYPAVVYIGG